MPYKNQKKAKEYADRWRRKHPTYMREYGRKLREETKRLRKLPIPVMEIE